MIQAENLNKFYGNLHVLKNVSLQIQKGEIVSIVGESGAGKSTLLQIISSLDKPAKEYSPKISINNTEITTLTDRELSQFRNKNIGFIFQFHQLLPEFTALENVTIPALIAKQSKQKAQEKAQELLEYLNLKHRLYHKPNALSGGEQQRVAVARALINNPKVIFADEPSGNLDSKNATELHQLFFDLRQKFDMTFVIVTHNNALAQMSDRILIMKDGKILS